MLSHSTIVIFSCPSKRSFTHVSPLCTNLDFLAGRIVARNKPKSFQKPVVVTQKLHLVFSVVCGIKLYSSLSD